MPSIIAYLLAMLFAGMFFGGTLVIVTQKVGRMGKSIFIVTHPKAQTVSLHWKKVQGALKDFQLKGREPMTVALKDGRAYSVEGQNRLAYHVDGDKGHCVRLQQDGQLKAPSGQFLHGVRHDIRVQQITRGGSPGQSWMKIAGIAAGIAVLLLLILTFMVSKIPAGP